MGLEHNITCAVAAGLKQKNNSPLGGALGAADTLLGSQLVHIAGHLTLQKLTAVWPAQLDIASWVNRFAHCSPAVKLKIYCANLGDYKIVSYNAALTQLLIPNE